MERYGFYLTVASDSIQADNPHAVEFPYIEIPLSMLSIARIVIQQHIDIVIDFMELRHKYLFPTYFVVKCLFGRKMVYWGQGRDLADRDAWIKNLAYATEQAFSDAIILYADHLKKYVPSGLHHKVFIANNTIVCNYPGLSQGLTKDLVLNKYGIRTRKNIICIGRMQKRKRLEILAEATKRMNRPDVGLILVGPDPDGVLDEINGNNIYKLGPIYGDNKFDLLSSSDVYCLPGAVGLSIIDSFYCGLPFVTEDGDESAEIMFLKNGVNGFVVRRGDISALCEKLLLLLDNDDLRTRFSDAAKREIAQNGSIDKMCFGFKEALSYVTRRNVRAKPQCS